MAWLAWSQVTTKAPGRSAPTILTVSPSVTASLFTASAIAVCRPVMKSTEDEEIAFPEKSLTIGYNSHQGTDTIRTVMERLRDRLAGFPATERRVAHRILADYPVAGLQSASDLARDVGVSAPSVLRMVSRMGFASYPDFQRVMREELTAQLSSPLSKSPAAARRQMGTTVAPRLQKFVTVLEGNLHETFTHLPTAEFDQVVRLLADRGLRLHLIGGRFTDALARYLSAQLRIVRPGVNHL